jgi:hypothetical protein
MATLEDDWKVRDQAAHSVTLLKERLRAAKDPVKILDEIKNQFETRWLAQKDATVWAAGTGLVSVLGWTTKYRARNLSQLQTTYENEIRAAIAGGHVTVLNWLAQKDQNFSSHRLTALAMGYGHIPVLEWMLAHGHTTFDKIRAAKKEAMRATNYVEMIFWLDFCVGIGIEDFDNRTLYCVAYWSETTALDFLVRRGKASLKLFGLLFVPGVGGRYGMKFVKWLGQYVVLPEILPYVSVRNLAFLTQHQFALTVVDYYTYAEFGSKMLCSVIQRGSRTFGDAFHYPPQIITGAKCLRVGGAALHAAVRQKRERGRKLLRCLISRCRLTPSDFSSVGLDWPPFE